MINIARKIDVSVQKIGLDVCHVLYLQIQNGGTNKKNHKQTFEQIFSELYDSVYTQFINQMVLH